MSSHKKREVDSRPVPIHLPKVVGDILLTNSTYEEEGMGPIRIRATMDMIWEVVRSDTVQNRREDLRLII